ncbi:response regulator [Pelomonas sp. KK5]|uniref:response regulator n=1 Tax=Pelomonas sp. KK5 TaxID=1855730 RepID=UPI00097C61E8|nr:response regulator [Pelomonas sp. KK5]
MNPYDQVEILLVEDSPNDAELAMRALRKGGLANKLLWVKDGEEALDYLFRQGQYADREQGSPRLVFLDLKMPRVDGTQVLRQIKQDERTRRIPVVIMTSSEEESDMIRSYDLGANSYVVKPLAFNAMVDVVHEAGYYWLAVNKHPQAL